MRVGRRDNGRKQQVVRSDNSVGVTRIIWIMWVSGNRMGPLSQVGQAGPVHSVCFVHTLHIKPMGQAARVNGSEQVLDCTNTVPYIKQAVEKFPIVS